MNYEQARFNMIEPQIRPWEVLDNQVLSLLAVVKREDFVPLVHRALAFVDMEIPLTAKLQQHPDQCMLAPKVEARIYNAEVRTGDGAANLARAVSGSDPLRGPFDVIALSGSVAEVPAALLNLLKVGGRLSAIVGFEPVMRATLTTRVADNAWHTTQAWDTLAARLMHFPEPSTFSF